MGEINKHRPGARYFHDLLRHYPICYSLNLGTKEADEDLGELALLCHREVRKVEDVAVVVSLVHLQPLVACHRTQYLDCLEHIVERRALRCTLCSAKCPTRDHLMWHVINVHERHREYCEVCTYNAYYRNLTSHYKTKHHEENSSSPPALCMSPISDFLRSEGQERAKSSNQSSFICTRAFGSP